MNAVGILDRLGGQKIYFPAMILSHFGHNKSRFWAFARWFALFDRRGGQVLIPD
jgi:hypothetical protein